MEGLLSLKLEQRIKLLEFWQGLLAGFNGLSLRRSDAKEEFPMFVIFIICLSSQEKI